MKKRITKSMLLLIAFVMFLTALTVGSNAFAADEEVKVVTTTHSETYERFVSSQSREFSNKKLYGADIKYNGSYGAQISGLSKEIYNSMKTQFITKRIGSGYTFKFKAPILFNALVVGNSIVENDSLRIAYDLIGDAVQCAMDAFLYDYPQAYWIFTFSTSSSVTAEGNDVIGWVGKITSIDITPVEAFYNASSYIKTFDANVQKDVKFLKEKIKEFGYDLYNRYDVATLIHDYICVNAFYKYDPNDYDSDYIVYGPAPFFIGDCGFVCEGYSESFKILCDEFNIPCVLVSGDAGGPHMWNYVQMEDNKWYLVDATWDDQGENIYRTYCVASANQQGFDDIINRERTPDGDFNNSKIMSFVYPVLSTTSYVKHTHQWDNKYTTDKKATCTQKGSKSIHCKTCNATKQKQDIPMVAHKYKNTAVKTKSTLKADGIMSVACTVCNKKSSTVIYKPDKMTLSSSGYTYNGKVKTPSVTVKDRKGNTLKKDTDYIVSYAKGRKVPGKYAVKLTFKGKYSGTKTLYFTIAPSVTSKVTAKSTITTLTLKWNAVTGATNYRVYRYNANNKKYESIASGLTKPTYTIKKLKGAKAYKFKIVAYTKVGSTTIWGDYSKVYTFSTAPGTPALTVTSPKKGTAQVSWKNVSGESAYEVYYSTSQNSGYKKLGNCKANVTKATISKLTSGKVYYFRVRAIIKAPSGTAYGGYQTVGVRIK